MRASSSQGKWLPSAVDVHSNSSRIRLQAVNGYQLHAVDGIVGHVCDFMMDDRSWAIRPLVIKIGHRFTGKEVLIPVSLVERISYQESTVFAKLTQDDVEKSPEHSLVPEVVAVAGEHVLTL